VRPRLGTCNIGPSEHNKSYGGGDTGRASLPFRVPAWSGPSIGLERVITYYHAVQRFLHVLRILVQRHEAAFGVLEVVVRQRAICTPLATTPPGGQ
jgi:hypothetical protein